MEYPLQQSPARKEYLNSSQFNPVKQLPYSHLVAVNKQHVLLLVQNTTTETALMPDLLILQGNLTQETTGLKWTSFPNLEHGGSTVGDVIHLHMNGKYKNAAGSTFTINNRGPGNYGNSGASQVVTPSAANSSYQHFTWDLYWSITGQTPLPGGNVSLVGNWSWEFVYGDQGTLKFLPPLFFYGSLGDSGTRLSIAPTLTWSAASADNTFVIYHVILRKI